MDDLRMYIRMKNISIVKIADVLSVTKRTVFRWLNYYDADHHKRITEAIEQIEGNGYA